ncbi:MAG: arginine--tRNA ligase [Caldilineaceae bacterium]
MNKCSGGAQDRHCTGKRAKFGAPGLWHHEWTGWRKPFKTRERGTMKLRYLIDMVTEKARERLAEVQAAEGYPAAEKEEIARMVGVATLKFADLSNQRTQNYVFDLDRFSGL